MKTHNTRRIGHAVLCASAASIIISSSTGVTRAQPSWQAWGAIPYLAIGGGVNFESNPSLQGLQDIGTRENHPISTTTQSGLGTGWVGLIAEGLDFKNGWRAELEESYRHNSGARFNVQAEGSTSVGIDRSTFAAMVNLWRDFALFNQLSAHIGGGLGIASVGMDITSTYGVATSTWNIEGAYQAGVGFDYLLSPGVKVTLDYRAFGFFAHNSSNIGVPTSCGVSPSPKTPCDDTTTEVVSLNAANGQIDQSIILGLRYAPGP